MPVKSILCRFQKFLGFLWILWISAASLGVSCGECFGSMGCLACCYRAFGSCTPAETAWFIFLAISGTHFHLVLDFSIHSFYGQTI